MDPRREQDEATLDSVQDPPQAEMQPPPVCAWIRTKMQYVTPGHPDGWERVSATAGYWCVHTMSPVGPDEEQATPRRCRPGRGCFEEA